MAAPFKLDEWVLLVREHNGVRPGTSVRVSKVYNSPRTVEITCPPAAGGATFDVPATKLARRPGRTSLQGRLRKSGGAGDS
ncbi:MAG: hypothetical protein ACR2OD_03455 [Gaiellaceae bacterium]